MKNKKLKKVVLDEIKEGDKIAQYGIFSNLTFVSRQDGYVTLKDKNGNLKSVYEHLVEKYGFVENGEEI